MNIETLNKAIRELSKFDKKDRKDSLIITDLKCKPISYYLHELDDDTLFFIGMIRENTLVLKNTSRLWIYGYRENTSECYQFERLRGINFYNVYIDTAIDKDHHTKLESCLSKGSDVFPKNILTS
jgi:hypothetical protein